VHGVEFQREDGSLHDLEAETVVVAAGAWSSALLEPAWGLPPLRPVQGQTLRLRGPHGIAHVVRTPHVYLVPRDSDELIVGATSDERGFDTGARAGDTLELLRRAWQTLPAVADLCVDEIAVGLRPAFGDGAPRIGAVGPKGLHVALGHFRNGILMAPATAMHLAEWILSGRIPESLRSFLPIAPATPAAFTMPAESAMSAASEAPMIGREHG
jgi:glycine oxidase